MNWVFHFPPLSNKTYIQIESLKNTKTQNARSNILLLYIYEIIFTFKMSIGLNYSVHRANLKYRFQHRCDRRTNSPHRKMNASSCRHRRGCMMWARAMALIILPSLTSMNCCCWWCLSTDPLALLLLEGSLTRREGGLCKRSQLYGKREIYD